MNRSGQRFGRYEIRSELGAGGMGEVFLAFDTVLQRLVALKMVRRDKDGPEAVLRLMSEARAAAALKHPNVVTLLDVGEVDGVAFLAMEYVEGKTLRTYVSSESVPVATKLDWLRQLATALAAAHAIGIIHRDVKPENVIVATDGIIKVLDFGIAKRLVATDTSAPTSDAPMSVRTAEGRVVGTSAYMAPEQRAGEAPHGSWDQFAWGMTSFELLSGLRPTGRAAPLLSTFVPDVPFDVAVLIARAMAFEPTERHASMSDIARALGSATSSIQARAPANAPNASLDEARPSQPAKRSRAVVFGVALLALLSGAGAMFAWARRKPLTIPVATPSASAQLASASVASPPASSLTVDPPTPATSASATAVARPTTRGKLGCVCDPLKGPNGSLCPKERLKAVVCHCEATGGQSLCAVPYSGTTSNAACDKPAFGLTMTARDGDPCDGYNGDSRGDTLLNSHLTGKLTGCSLCALEDVTNYFGTEGSSCVGYRGDLTPVPGVISCDNLRFRCNRGEQGACADLPMHK